MSARWRSLTLTYTSPAWMTNPDDLVRTTMAGLSDIAVIAGCAASPSAAHQILSKREGRLHYMVMLARSLREKITGVVSSDFEVLVVRPGEEFTETDMCLVEGERRPTRGVGTVLGMTRVGLTRRAPEGSKGEKVRRTVVKAEVVLK